MTARTSEPPATCALAPGDRVVVRSGRCTTPAYEWFEGLQIPIPASEVAKELGKTIDVDYIVNDEVQSQWLQPRVQAIEDGDAALLPTPTFKELNGFAVTFDQSASKDNAIAFPVGRYRIRHLVDLDFGDDHSMVVKGLAFRDPPLPW